MGMFDWVQFDTLCPKCGAGLSGFQTKDASCTMSHLSPLEAMRFYSWCEECGCRITVEMIPPEKAQFIVTARDRSSLAGIASVITDENGSLRKKIQSE